MNSDLFAKFRRIKEQESIKLKYSKDMLINRLQEKAKELGHTPLMKEMSNPSAKTYYAYFTYWQDALDEAGLESLKKDYKIYTDNDLIRILQEKFLQLGRIPKVKDFIIPQYSIYVKKFDGFKNALIAANISIVKNDKDNIKRRLVKDTEKITLILKLRTEGKTFKEIGVVLGVSKQRIQQICKRINK